MEAGVVMSRGIAVVFVDSDGKTGASEGEEGR